MRVLERLRRRSADPRAEAAAAAYAAGDFATARDLAAEVVGEGDAPLEAVQGLAELEYLLGRYDESGRLYRRAAEEAGRDRGARVQAELGLALVCLQANRFAESRGLFAGVTVELPIWSLMTSFGDEPPYRIGWHGRDEVALPMLQKADWELPCVAVEIDGAAVEARLDTGGDLLVLTRELAAELGVEPVTTATGTFAGGAKGAIGYGRVASVRLGGLAVEAVPVSILDLDRPMVGTGFLRRFLATVDYPGRRVVLRPPGSLPPPGAGVPFALATTHLLVARGSLNEAEPLTWILDSGLQHEGGAALAVPAETLRLAGIPEPEAREELRESGAGYVSLQIGEFPVERLGLGSLAQTDLSGLTGVFPPEWSAGLGFPVHGLVSHGFLRRYAWTLDFERMTMTFSA